MTNAPSHFIRTTLYSLTVWVLSQVPSHLVGLPTGDQLEVCGYENASIRNLMLPVLPGDPRVGGKEKDIVFDLLISPEGKLVASAPFYAPSKDFISPVRRAMTLSVFDPALECDEPASSFIRHTVTDYFFVADPVAEGAFVPAEPLWILDPYMINQLDMFCRFSGEKEGVHLEFAIGADGQISDMIGGTKAAEVLIEHFFEPGRDRLTFTPATLSGEPIESRLILRLSNPTSSSHVAEERTAEKRFEPMPRNPMSNPDGEEFEVAAAISFDSLGNTTSARVDPNTPGALATAIIAAVRSWTYLPEGLNEGPFESEVTCRFGFVPGEKEAFLLEEPEKVVWALPVPTKRVAPRFPYELKKARLSGLTELVFVVTTKGRVRDIKVLNSNHAAFSQAATNAVADWRFKPGRRNKEKVEFRMMLPIKFDVTN